MIEPGKLSDLKEKFDTLESQIGLFKDKVKTSKEIEPNDNTPEEEKQRILELMDAHRKEIGKIPRIVEDSVTGKEPVKKTALGYFPDLLWVDQTLYKFLNDVGVIADEQYACRLELYFQEISRTIGAIIDLMDFIFPNIRYEIDYLKSFYRIPENMSQSILPELEKLLDDFENHSISFNEFIFGYEMDGEKVLGYNGLRVKNNFYSRFQFFENRPEAYREINTIFQRILATIQPFLNEKRNEPELSILLNRLTKGGDLKIIKMEDIFRVNGFLHSINKIVGKKYSYREEYKKIKPMMEQFHELQKPLIIYNENEISRMENALAKRCEGESKKFESIMVEMKKHLKDKSIPFKRIDLIFDKLFNKDFNVVVIEKDAEDITIKITPHLEKKYGRDLLERINIVIQEIDFWYPPDSKEILFNDLSKTTSKIQADEPVNKKAFFELMQKYDKEIENHLRKTYPDKIRLLNTILENFNKTFSKKMNRERLEKRLMNKDLWKEIQPKILEVTKYLKVLESVHASLSENVNKFPFIKGATEELSQLFYDLSMQLFVGYDGKDPITVMNMTNILSTYNEFHDAKSLSSAFSHYFHKLSISSFPINEKIMIDLSADPRCKNQLHQLFPPKERAP